MERKKREKERDVGGKKVKERKAWKGGKKERGKKKKGKAGRKEEVTSVTWLAIVTGG